MKKKLQTALLPIWICSYHKMLFSMNCHRTTQNFPHCNVHCHQFCIIFNLCHGHLLKWVHCTSVQHYQSLKTSSSNRSCIVSAKFGPFADIHLHLSSETVMHTQRYGLGNREICTANELYTCRCRQSLMLHETLGIEKRKVDMCT